MTGPAPFRIGIIGAENSHAAAIAREINIAGTPAGFAVTKIWGETPEFAASTAKAGQIPEIVSDPQEMLGQVDGVMVDHRDGQYHVAAARPFVEAGIPVFVDKPLSTSLAEAREFLRFRRERGVAVTTLSGIPHQSCIGGIRRKLGALGALRAVHLNGPGDPHSRYGGVFFYGIHQVDLMVSLFGIQAESAIAVINGSTLASVVTYPDGLNVTIGMPGVKSFSITAVGAEGAFHEEITMDASSYAATTELFTTMFRDGTEPYDDARMLAPIAVLEALREAVATGRKVAVPAVA
ncbi:MAG: Gfo/Idh/MocA family oxidoreductase [bacterium]